MKTRILFCILAALVLAPMAQAQGAASASSDPQSDPQSGAHMAKAMTLRTEAVAAYDAGDYDAAAELARQAKAELGLIQAASAKPALPASFTVRLIPESRDSLYKIAAFPFVYGDGESWVYLYRANKNALKHPENADLILPGEVLVIPSIGGETRSGEYVEGRDYPSFTK
jgi:nucleoid-associated protein YgaU